VTHKYTHTFFPGSNHPKLSAIRWRFWHPEHLTNRALSAHFARVLH